MSKTADRVRQTLNLILPPAMWISSSLPQFTDLGRTIQEQSESNNTLLVPFGPAFAIWFPIFIGCITYGIIQARPSQRENGVFRRIGWLTAASFALITLWGYMAAFPPPAVSQWGTALTFVPAMLLICAAVVRLRGCEGELSDMENLVIRWPLSWLAGWCSLAMFLNWAQLGVHGPLGFGLSETQVCLTVLIAALLWVMVMIKKTRGSRAYVFPVVWGLAFLVIARVWVTNPNPVIAYAAALGALALIAFTIRVRAAQ